MNRVFRERDTVVRVAGACTPTVHRYLEHVRLAGVDWVPRPVEHTGDQERLTYLSGVVPVYPLPEWVWAESVLLDGARRLRQLHDASMGFSPDGATWQAPAKIPAEVICHNDFAPHNLVFDEGRIVGLIDVDMCSPGPRLWDLAYYATRIVPLTATAPAGAPPMSAAVARVSRILAAYGTEHTVTDVLRVAILRLWDLAVMADQKSIELGDDELRVDAAGYRRDAEFLTAWRASEIVDEDNLR